MAKILVVDESNLSRRISRKILQEAGHEVVEAEDGVAALERYFLAQPDAVLLDIPLKGMSGIEALGKLRELDPHARVVIATADIQSSTRALTREAGASGFITKPLAAEQVVCAIDAALRGGR